MKNSATQDPSQPRTYTLAQRLIAGVLLMTMELVPIRVGVDQVLALRLGRAAHAAPVADPAAPLRFQPAMTQTAGSSPVPVVNITAPNAAGASLNRYRQFNVDPGGLVINNSTTGGGTLLGGAVNANPLLNGRAASVIINEVTSRGDAFASAINGAIEVYGPRADLVIANPNGIACNGCAFVNTPRITLTTGTPQFLDAPNGAATSFDAAVAWAYDVRGGAIRIGAPGGQAGIEGTVGQIDLIAESIGLYAPLRAGIAANLVAGRQSVAFDAAGNVVHAANGENAGAGYAIDASELGAVTAGQIRLIATAAGPGVRVDGRLAASSGDLLISADGDVSVGAAYASRDLRASSNATLTLAGDAFASGDMVLLAGRKLSTAGLSAQSIRLDAGGTLSGSGAINAAGTISMDAGGSIMQDGAVDAGGTLSLHAKQDITLLGRAQGMDAAQLDARGKASVHDLSSAGSVKIDAGGDITTGIVQSDAEVRLTSGGGIRTQGALSAAGAVTLDAEQDAGIAAGVHSGARLDVKSRSGSVIVTGDASADGDVLVGAATDISVIQGSLTAKGKLSAKAGRGIDIAGDVQADRALELTADSADLAVRGQLYTGEALTVRAGAGLALDGKVAAAGAAIATAGGSVTMGGISEFGNTLDVEAGGVATFKRSLTVVDKATLTAGGLQVGGNAVIGGKLNAIISGDAALDGDLTALSDMTLHAKGDVGLGGTTLVMGNATAGSGKNMTLAGNLIAGGDVRLDAGEVLSQTSGLIGAAGSLKASGDKGLSSKGAMIAGADATVESARGAVQIGYASAQGDLAVNAGRNNESEALEAQGNIRQTAGGSIVNRGAVLAGGSLVQHAGGDIEQAGANIGKTITATADGDILYRNTTVTGLLDLQAGKDLTLSGAVDAGAAKLSAANRLASDAGTQQIRGVLTGDAASITLDADITSAGNATFTARSGDLAGAGAVKAGGNLIFDAQGRINRSGFSGAMGKLSASGVKGVTLGDTLALGDSIVTSTGGNATLSGSAVSIGNTTVTAGGDILVGTSLLAWGKADMSAGGKMDINGTVETPGNVRLEAGGAMTVNADVRADGNATLIGADIVNQALLSAGGDVSMQATGKLDSGAVRANGNVTLGGARVVTGATRVAGDFAIHGGDITLGGDTKVRGASAFTGKDMDNRGALVAGKRLDITVDTLTNTANSELIAVGDTVIGAREVRNAGTIYGANTSIISTGTMDNTGGVLLSKESTTLQANALIGNRNGMIASDGDVVVRVPGLLDNGGGVIYAARNLTLSLPGRTFDPSAATNGTLGVNNKLTIVADGFNNSGDWTVPGMHLDLQIQQSFINSGVLQKAGDLSIATPAAIENSGQMMAGGKLALAGSAISNTGLLHANEDLTLTAGGDIVNTGLLQAAGKLKLQGDALDNRNTNQTDAAAAGIHATGDIRIDMARLVDNTVGNIIAGGDVTISAPEVRNDRAPQSESIVNTTSYSKEVLDGLLVETNRTIAFEFSGDAGGMGTKAIPDATLGDYLPDYKTNTVASPATVLVEDGTEGGGSHKVNVGGTVALPVVDVTTVEQHHGREGVIVAGRDLRIDAPMLLSNRGGAISAKRDTTLNVGSLENGPSATLTNGTVESVNPSDLQRFIDRMNIAYWHNDATQGWIAEPLLNWEVHPRTIDKRVQTPGVRGDIATGRNLSLSGPSLANSGNITAGGDASITADVSFSNQGNYTSSLTSRPGCMPGAASCNEVGGSPRVESFSFFSDPNALVAGGKLTINAPLIANTHAIMAARGDITLTADRVNNVAGVIQSTSADLIIKAREVVNRVEAPAVVHESWGSLNPPYAPGCNPGRNYKDSQCNVERDVAASPAPVLSAARDLSISGDALSNIGGLITAGRKADIDMQLSLVNEPQPLALHWRGYWIKDPGIDHGDIPQPTYGTVPLPPQNAAIQAPSVQIKVNGVLQNAGNIVGATVDLSGARLINGISAPDQPNPPPTGMRQVTLLGQDNLAADSLARASTRSTASQSGSGVTPVNAARPELDVTLSGVTAGIVTGSVMSQVTAQRNEGASLAKANVQAAAGALADMQASGPAAPQTGPVVAQTAAIPHYATVTPDASRPDATPALAVRYLNSSSAHGAAVLGGIGPQQLLDNLPQELRGATPLPFAYDPYTENQLLQRQALESTGRSYYINGLSFDDRHQSSLDDQQKAVFYANAIDYATAQRLSLGQPLSESQIAALDRPMLWYVEQQVPDASCHDIGQLSQANCPTVAALAPVLYLDQASLAMLSTQSIGLISGEDVTTRFTDSITNSGVISGVHVEIDTPQMINQKRSIDIGRSTYEVEGGWVDMTGTRVETGGYVMAQKLSGEVQRWESLGGTLQIMNEQGGVDVAQTDALMDKLGSVLGLESYSHTELKDDIHVEFMSKGTDVFQVIGMIAAVVVACMIGPAVSAYVGEGAAAGSTMAAAVPATAASAGVAAGAGNIVVSGFITGATSSMAGQFVGTGEVSVGAAIKAGAVGGLTGGVTEWMGLNKLAGIQDVGDGLLRGSFDAAQLGNMMQGIGGRALVSAFVTTSINGGSFGQAFMNSVAGDMGAIGANAIGLYTDAYTLPNVLGHAAIGCLAAAIASRDCVSGAIGAAASALITPAARDALYSGENNLEQVPGADGTLLMRETYSDPVKNAMVTGMSMLSGSMAAGLTGRDAGTAADAARNEALNNALSPKLKELANAGPNCKAGDCVQYMEALKTEKARTQLEYDACMRAADCTAARAADLGSDLLRLQTTYEQTVRRGIYVGDLNWNGTGNPVPADYFDGLTGLGAIGTGAALRGNALRASERPEGIASGGNRGSVNPVPEAEPVKNASNTVGTADALLPDAGFQARLPSDALADVQPAGNRMYGLNGQGVGAPRAREVGANSIRTGGTVELFTDASGPKVPGAVGVGPKDITAVASDARSMPNIPSNSQATVVANNPFIPPQSGGTMSMTDYLPEAARITQPGGRVVINGNESNPYFNSVPTTAQLDALGLKIQYQGNLLPEYQGLRFARTDGSAIPNDTMRTVVFIKK